MEQSVRMWQAQAQGGQGQLSPMQLQQLLQMIESSMPAQEVLHALHVEALKDPDLRDHPAMQRFTDVELHGLHSQVAAAGIIRRILSGDRTDNLPTLLAEQLGVVVRTHMDAKSAFTRLFADRKNNPVLQSMSQVFGMVDQQFSAMRPVLARLVPEEVFTGAH